MNELRPIEDLLAELDTYTGFTKFDLVDEALARREEIVPHLLAILERIMADPEGWLDGEHDIHSYALVLLTHFGEAAAHPLLLRLFSLPYELVDPLFGEMLGETLPAALFRTSGGSLEGIRELILDRQAPDICRWSACTALTYAVAAGELDRAEAVRFFAGLLQQEQAEPESCTWEGIIDGLIELHPGEAMAEIEAAYAAGLVDETFADLDYIRSKADLDVAAVLAELQEEYRRRTPENVHDYMRWWDQPGLREALRAANTEGRKRQDHRQRKNKKKQAKKSKRRNRK